MHWSDKEAFAFIDANPTLNAYGLAAKWKLERGILRTSTNLLSLKFINTLRRYRNLKVNRSPAVQRVSLRSVRRRAELMSRTRVPLLALPSPPPD